VDAVSLAAFIVAWVAAAKGRKQGLLDNSG